MLFFPTDYLKCRRRLFKYWFFSPSCVLCRGDAILRHKERGDVNGCWGCRWKFGSGRLFMHGMQDLKMMLWKMAFLHIISDKQAANVNPGKMQNNLVVRLLPLIRPHACELTVRRDEWHQRRPNSRDISINTGSTRPRRRFSQLVRSLEKYESEVTEHGLNDGFGVLGGAQVSTEMRFNTVSRHKW